MEITTNQNVSEKTSEQNTKESIEVTRKSNIPRTDIELLNLCLNVEQKWKAVTGLTLMWTTQKEFSKFILEYQSAYKIRVTEGSKRPAITQQLNELDKKIDNSISYVKGYLAEKYGKKVAISHYSEFGIKSEGKNYIIPHDRDYRIEAITMLLNAIIKNGFSAATYGEAYWTKIKKSYTTLLQTAISTDSSVSKYVSSKNEIKKYLKKALNSLICIIKGNYPDTYKSEFRNWGFQKEKY